MVVKGKISNKSIATTYKDIEIKMTFYSKTGALLENDKEVIYENVGPGTSEEQESHFRSTSFVYKTIDQDLLALHLFTKATRLENSLCYTPRITTLVNP